MGDETGSKLTFVLGFAAFFAALWFLWDTSIVYPLKIFVVLLHEISHAIASVATGGVDQSTLGSARRSALASSQPMSP